MIDSDQFLDLLMQRFSMPLPEGNEISVEAFKVKNQKPIQVRICQLIKTWITKYFYDFENNKELLDKLLDFCTNIIKPVCPPGATLENILKRQINKQYDKTKEIQYTAPPPEPILKNQNFTSILDIHPLEIARQLTIIESNLYRNIRPQECLGLAWSKKNAQEKAPNILKMINRFNIVSNWVCSEIITKETHKQRVDTLSHFIEITDYCRSLNNFNACMEIMAGLGDSSIHRLKNHWSELSKKINNIFSDMETILSSDQSYKNFRAYLKTTNGACIPYLGMYLTDLTFIEDGNPDKIGDLHNFSKRIFVSNVIQEIQQYQQAPYILTPVSSIQDFLLQIHENLIDKEECYQISLQILPRGGAVPSSSSSSNQSTSSNTSTSTSNVQQSSPVTSLNVKMIKSNSGNSNSLLSPRSTLLDDKIERKDYGEMEMIPNYPFNSPDLDINIRFDNMTNELHEISNLTTSSSAPNSQKISSGTIYKIIERMTFKIFPEAQLISSFLLTYRNYISGCSLLDLLILRFNMPLPIDKDQLEQFKKEELLPVQIRVINVIKNWIENYPNDFIYEKKLYKNFLFFINSSTSIHLASLKRILNTLQQKIPSSSAISSSSSPLSNSLHHTLENLSNLGSSSSSVTAPRDRRGTVSFTQPTPSTLPLQANANPNHLTFLDFHPIEIARQLCLFSCLFYSNIQSTELLNEIWKSDPKKSIYFHKFYHFYYAIKNWAIQFIISAEIKNNQKKNNLIQLLSITTACYELQNYYLFCAFDQALQSNEIKCLFDSLEIPSDILLKFLENTKKINSIKNFRELILNEIRFKDEPRIPPLEIYLQEIHDIESENDFIDDNKSLINMVKNRKIYLIVNEFLSHQKFSYSFHEQAWLTNFFKSQILPFAERDIFSDQIVLHEQLSNMSKY